MYESNAFVKCLYKYESLTMHLYEMVSSACELSYMVWLPQTTTNVHFETEISSSKNQEILWSDKELPNENEIPKVILVKREVSNMSYPRRSGSPTVNSLSKRTPNKTQSVFIWHPVPINSMWGQLAEWAILIWQIKPTGSGNYTQRWR